MSFPLLWLIWALLVFVSFGVLEGIGLVSGAKRGSLTSNVMWLITGAGWWHQAARIVLAALLAWLPLHFGLS